MSAPPLSAPTPSGRPPVVRLPTWVNIVLVLILLASCGASRMSAGDVAQQVAQRVGASAGSDGGLDSQELEDICRLLGAIAAREDISPQGVMGAESMTRCHEVAQEVATATAP